MSIESMMYFALGALAAALLMLMIMPAIWRRAVRLTKKRIEAATPITLAEFRADKDQLRAEFALSTRRLEMNVEQLRKRLSEQLGDVSRKRGDLAALKTERDAHLAVVRELEEREAQLRARVLELEREGAELVQRLQLRDHDLAQKISELESARLAIRETLPPSIRADGQALTGNYDEDVDDLLTALAVERKRASHLEAQVRGFAEKLEKLDVAGGAPTALVTALKNSLARSEDSGSSAKQDLVEAEVRIANAESRFNALIQETADVVATKQQQHERLLADKLSLEAQMQQLRDKVLAVETTVMADWDTERLEQEQLRARLDDIASEVSRLVYAVDNGPAATDPEESLFDRVQRFADDGLKVENFPVRNGAIVRPTPGGGTGGPVSERMVALRELQARN